ncbi:MAG: hypothetical protein ACE1ZA_08245, partial [Pseudomonadales bacterium]
RREVMKVISHLTVNGTPFCQHPLSRDMRYSDITCGHKSLAAAGRARCSLQHRAVGYHDEIQVVRGRCPS